MAGTSNEAKQKWNAAHYTQIKVSVAPDIASAFKATCAANGASIAGTLARLMSEYNGKATGKERKSTAYGTRSQRRGAVQKMLMSLADIKQAEENYAEKMPENLRNSVRYEDAEQSINALDEVISLLSQAY